MKKCLVYVLLVATLWSCQKGPEDPVFSLSTRKARISVEWNVKSYSGMQPGLVAEYNGEKISYTINDSVTIERNLSWSFMFEKDGSYKISRVEDFEEDTIANTPSYSLNEIEKGVWEFSGGNDSPSKSKLMLLAEEIKSERSDQNSNVSVVTFESPRRATVYDIIGLSNEDLKIEYDEVRSFAGGSSRNIESFTMKKL